MKEARAPGLKIWGANDDIVLVEGTYKDGRTERFEHVRDFVVGDRVGGGVAIRMSHAWRGPNDGVWSATIAPLDANTKIPWPVTVVSKNFSAQVEIDCPVGTTIIGLAEGVMEWRETTR